MSRNIIELTDITFTYEGENTPVLKGLNLSVREGSCLVITGANGSGKTTLFRILNGLSFPQSGRYSFAGTDITAAYLKNNRNSKTFHKRIGYLFQNPDIMLFNGNVYDEVAFGPRQMGMTDDEVDARVADCMDLFRITELADKAPYHLSGGQKKRVALASVIALNPEVLILDEPYAGLDTETIEWLTSFLVELKQAGKTIILATHNLEAAGILADDTLTMK